MKKSKYGARKVEYNGMVFDSKGELKHWKELEALQDEGKISNLQRQIEFELVPKQTLNGKFMYHPIKYVADYVFDDENGETHYQDYKGMILPEFRLKQKLFYLRYGKVLEVVKG